MLMWDFVKVFKICKHANLIVEESYLFVMIMLEGIPNQGWRKHPLPIKDMKRINAKKGGGDAMKHKWRKKEEMIAYIVREHELAMPMEHSWR